MGEAPRGWLLLITGLMLFASVSGFATAQNTSVRLEVDAQFSESQPWIDPDHPLVLTPTIVNDGQAVSLTVNPKCPFVINVYNSTTVKVVDGQVNCLQGEQGLDLGAGLAQSFESIAWDMKNEDGEWLESGQYTVELQLTYSELTWSKLVTVQTPVELPSDLEYTVDWVQRTSTSEDTWLSMVSVYNPTNRVIDLQNIPMCRLEIRTSEATRLGSDCFADVNALMPGEMLLVEQLPITSNLAQTVTISTPGGSFVHEHLLPASASAALPIDAELSLNINLNEQGHFGQGDVLVAQLQLSSTSTAEQTITFTDSCRAELWIVDDFGEVVFDSRSEKSCQSINLETTLSPSEPLIFSLPQWGFFTVDGCRVVPGVYTIIAEIPEFKLVVSKEVSYKDPFENACSPPSEVRVDTEVSWADEQTLVLSSSLSTTGQEEFLRMTQPCTFVIDFLDSSGVTAHRLHTLCDDYDGRKVKVLKGIEPLKFNDISINMLQNGIPLLEDGVYTVQVTMLTTGTIQTTQSMTWPQDFLSTPPTSEEEVAEEIQSFEIQGQWSAFSTNGGLCYILEMEEGTYLLSHARTLPTWTPQEDVQGVYRVHETSASPACIGFLAPSVEVIEVLLEQSIVNEQFTDVPAESEEEEETVIPTTASVVTVVTVVVTASLVSLFGVFVVTNEGLRLPVTLAGLWFLGLFGKTQETTDGRYQRGRLMGYLTANPGCHFRALMSALDMSNGQITHHLRILEMEEHIWRREDGRLVRYYPLTNQLNPSTHDDELPIPPLSPDPNSLQGKILNLLDHDGDLGQFPTQAELAKRLEKSQQLISHHLRTLQKYGLVERRKMGVMNRYKLTREAIFLLESSEDFSQP